MRQVLIRKPIAGSSNKRLVKADVLADNGDMLRVKMEDSREPVDVQASDVVQPQHVFGSANVGRGHYQPVIEKRY